MSYPASAPLTIRNDTPWPMHAIDSRFRGANSLFGADVDGDGSTDYVTNYEFDQRYVITFTPTDPAAFTAPWPNMTFMCPTAEPATQGCDTESAMLADLDGDGNLDIAGAQGGHPDRIFDGDEPGIRVVWGPDRAHVLDPAAWQDGGRIPATIEQGHYLWVVPFDMNADGAVDILAGGRVYFANGLTGGIVWLQSPSDPGQRRDLSAWTLHAIDPYTPGGHGFVLTDLDADGDPDIVDANADFDTPEEDEAVLWYRNPGPGSLDLTQPWERTELVRDPGFYGKPQIAVADMNGDGLPDLVTQTIDEFLIFLRRADGDVAFDLQRIAKPEQVRWASRGLRVGDIDGDGNPDLVVMMTHDDATLPVGKASVYWLSFEGARLTAEDARVHVIKWSPGRVSNVPIFGEKWDGLELRDVDGDGDLDIVANDEEWMQEPQQEFVFYGNRTEGEAVSVVWFENHLADSPAACSEDANGCALDAERPTNSLDGTWIERNSLPGATGGTYLQAFNGNDPAQCPSQPRPNESLRDCPPRPDRILLPADSEGLRYRLNLNGGDYDVWMRTLAPVRFGKGLGGERSDSAYVGFDGNTPLVIGDAAITPGTWAWIKAPSPFTLAPGPHQLELRVRERGFAIDRIVLQTAGTSAPP
ncbi:MAG: FG-GAP-like repeat-containing protein [Halioglobus sp.]